MNDSAGARQLIEALQPFGRVLAIKLYRLTLDPAPAVPILPTRQPHRTECRESNVDTVVVRNRNATAVISASRTSVPLRGRLT